MCDGSSEVLLSVNDDCVISGINAVSCDLDSSIVGNTCRALGYDRRRYSLDSGNKGSGGTKA